MRKISGRFGAVARVTALMTMMLAAAIAAPAQTFKTIVSFTEGPGYPDTPLALGTDGSFFGAALFGGLNDGTVFKLTPAGMLATIHTFDGSDGDYCNGLVLGGDGNFYGTTQDGGSTGSGSAFGTVFKITPGGTLTTLHNFDQMDGARPLAGLVQATDGTFYGTTSVV